MKTEQVFCRNASPLRAHHSLQSPSWTIGKLWGKDMEGIDHVLIEVFPRHLCLEAAENHDATVVTFGASNPPSAQRTSVRVCETQRGSSVTGPTLHRPLTLSCCQADGSHRNRCYPLPPRQHSDPSGPQLRVSIEGRGVAVMSSGVRGGGRYAGYTAMWERSSGPAGS